MASVEPDQPSQDPRSFLLHVYRNCDDAAGGMVGTVERLGSGERQVFHSVGGLLQLLGLGTPNAGGRYDERAGLEDRQ